MSAIDREVVRRCPDCQERVVYRYDEAGSSRKFEATQAEGSLVPHQCATPRDRYVGTRSVATK
jgi:hypothetical protein